MNPAPTRWQKSTVRPSNVWTSTRPASSGPAATSAARMTSTRSVGRQQRRLARVLEDGDDDPVEHRDRPAQDVEVAVRDRIERAGVDREAHPPSRR